MSVNTILNSRPAYKDTGSHARGEQKRLMHVLIIEDDDTYADLIRIALKRAHIDSTLITTATEGINVARHMMPDVIIMDIALPGMNGLDAVAEIRNDPAISHIPIIVASASSTSRTRHEAEAVGADIFFEKPFPLNDMIDALKRFDPGGGA